VIDVTNHFDDTRSKSNEPGEDPWTRNLVHVLGTRGIYTVDRSVENIDYDEEAEVHSAMTPLNAMDQLRDAYDGRVTRIRQQQQSVMFEHQRSDKKINDEEMREFDESQSSMFATHAPANAVTTAIHKSTRNRSNYM
jgi:hypothetical protein